MTREDILAALKTHEPELRRRGVVRAAVFGSTAWGEEGPQSDIDVLIRFDPDVPITLWDYAGLKRRVAKMLGASKRKDRRRRP